jgi:hypothetical protein
MEQKMAVGDLISPDNIDRLVRHLDIEVNHPHVVVLAFSHNMDASTLYRRSNFLLLS